MSEEKDPRYPVGKFQPIPAPSQEDRRSAIAAIREMPARLRASVEGWSDEQLDTPYREGGWTVRQLIHHIADSHMTAFHRVRKALTEESPVVTGYDEKAFAELPDKGAPVELSLQILDGTHARWVMLLDAMSDDEWKRSFQHMERGPMTIEFATMLYAWHSKHHVAHITSLQQAQGW